MKSERAKRPHEAKPKPKPKRSKACGAKTRAGTSCKQEAGWGTKHLGSGKCKLHGGASSGTGPNNTNAKKHGMYGRAIAGKDEDMQLIAPELQDGLDAITAAVDEMSELELLRGNLRKQIRYLRQCFYVLEKRHAALAIDDPMAMVAAEQGYARTRGGLLRSLPESIKAYTELLGKLRELGIMQDDERPSDVLAGIEFGDGTIAPVLIGEGASLEEIRAAIDTSSRPPSDPDVDPS